MAAIKFLDGGKREFKAHKAINKLNIIALIFAIIMAVKQVFDNYNLIEFQGHNNVKDCA